MSTISTFAYCLPSAEKIVKFLNEYPETSTDFMRESDINKYIATVFANTTFNHQELKDISRGHLQSYFITLSPFMLDIMSAGVARVLRFCALNHYTQLNPS